MHIVAKTVSVILKIESEREARAVIIIPNYYFGQENVVTNSAV